VSAVSIVAAVALVVFGYLMGSLSPSVWLGRAVKGIDVRDHGSGNAGSTNAFRVLGKGLGVAVLVCDILKGVIPVVLARYLSNPWVTVGVAIVTVIGHTFSIFLKGRGGKGVATGAGAAIAMIPVPMACLLALFVVMLLSTRIVSASSMAATAALPIGAGLLYHYHATGVWATPLAYVVACCLMALVVLWSHRSNVVRLFHGTERRIILPWSKKGKGQPAAVGRTHDSPNP
jgi:glycerol-3-phosphate acyltransferase PlsY